VISQVTGDTASQGINAQTTSGLISSLGGAVGSRRRHSANTDYRWLAIVIVPATRRSTRYGLPTARAQPSSRCGPAVIGTSPSAPDRAWWSGGVSVGGSSQQAVIDASAVWHRTVNVTVGSGGVTAIAGNRQTAPNGVATSAV